MKTICFVTIKGGVGKSISTATIGDMMASKGKRVLLIDMDPQQNISSLFHEDSSSLSTFENLRNGTYVNNRRPTIDYLLLHSEEDPLNYIEHTSRKKLDLIPSSPALAEIEELLKAETTMPQQFKLKYQLDKIKEHYDYCLIDCGPSLGLLNINTLTAADEVYIPARTDTGSFEGVALTLRLIDTVSINNPALEVGGCFFTQWDRRTNNGKDAYFDMLEAISEYLLPIAIRTGTIVPESSKQKKTLLAMDKSMRNNVTKDYDLLTDFILAKDKPAFIKKKHLTERMDTFLGFDNFTE